MKPISEQHMVDDGLIAPSDDGRWTIDDGAQIITPSQSPDTLSGNHRLSSLAHRLSAGIRRPSIWSVPVGLQLSVIYALLLALTLALLGTFLYIWLNGFLIDNTADRLESGRNAALEQAARRGGPRGGGGPRVLSIEDITNLTPKLSGSDVAVTVFDQQGTINVSAQSGINETAPQVSMLPANWADATIDNARGGRWIVTDKDGKRWVVLVAKIGALVSQNSDQEIELFLEQAASLEAVDGVLNNVRLFLVLGIIIGTIVGVLAGLALTRTVLRPLDKMVGTAEAIAEGDLQRRVHMPSGRNEVARLGAAFDNMVNRLAAALEAQRRFVADASHELRTPLTSLQGLSEMLLMGADQGDSRAVQRTVRGMHNELGRMGRLVNDLLTLSRLDGTAPVEFVIIDANKLIADVAEQMGPVAEARGVRLDFRLGGPAPVHADPDKLKQVVLNLVDNALRYSPEGSSVLLSVVNDPLTRQARIEVQDTGPGISPEDLPHIFDRFYRGDVSRARATGNSGLGLAIARAIVQAHGGMIEAQSAPGMGALFRVTLPAISVVPE